MQSIRLLTSNRHIVSFIIPLRTLKSPLEKKHFDESQKMRRRRDDCTSSTPSLFSSLSGDRLLLAGILSLIRSEFCQSDPIRSHPVRSWFCQRTAVATYWVAYGKPSRGLRLVCLFYFLIFLIFLFLFFFFPCR